MKAPSKVDKYLRAQGFGYSKPYYQRLHQQLPIVECLHFGKQTPGLLLHLMVVYVDKEGGPQISPREIEVVYPDGRLSAVPSTFEREKFFVPDDADKLVETIASVGFTHLAKLADPALMVQVLSFLMGDVGHEACLDTFPELGQPWARRTTTPFRLRSKAAYLNLLGRFDEAGKLLCDAAVQSQNPFDAKVCEDAKAGEIRFLAETKDYLRGIGART